MNEALKKFMSAGKNPKILVALGLCGIVLIFVSSLFPSSSNSKNNKNNASNESLTTEQYRSSLEESVAKIVRSITGDRNATVVVTLDSGVRYTYADALDTNSSNTSGQNSETASSSSSKTYITVKTDDGGEKALVVTESMPEVRGVAIVCIGGDNEPVAEKIRYAVMAALNITSKRVYIAGGSSYEKR